MWKMLKTMGFKPLFSTETGVFHITDVEKVEKCSKKSLFKAV